MKTNESGRSMVEMLGVLAVMAVLALGGISGYVLAVNRHKANHILDVAGKLAGMGVGGKTFSSLKAAGLEADDTSVDMRLYRDGVVCIWGMDADTYDAVAAQAMAFSINYDECKGGDRIAVKFSKRR